jgi:hypothetical protein
LAKLAFEEGHEISWNEAKILQIESNSRQRKYKESAHMACMENPIRKSNLEFHPIWIPLVKEVVNNLQRGSYL